MLRGSKSGKSHVTNIASTVMFGLQDTNVRQISVQFSKIHSITNYKIVWTLHKRNMDIESVYLTAYWSDYSISCLFNNLGIVIIIIA
jgi:hypothetical protein